MRTILTALLFISAVFAQVSSVPGATGSGGGGTGTVTHTGGALTADAVVVGAGAADSAVSNCTKATGQPLTCTDGFSTGSGGAGLGIQLSGATSGLATIKPPAVAGTPTFTLPGTVSDTLMGSLTPVLAAQVPWVSPNGGFALNSGVMGSTFYSNMPAAQTDIYTSPASTRTLLGECVGYNTSVSSSTLTYYIKEVGGTYRRLAGTTTIATITTGTAKNVAFILDPGEGLAITPTVAGVNMGCRWLQFSSSEAYYSARITTLTVGQNTLYTAPPGKVAIPMGTSSAANVILSGAIVALNDSGGSRTYTPYVVPSGGSPGTSNQIGAGVVITNGSGGNVPAVSAFQPLNAGDFISINVDAGTATQWVYMNVLER